MHCLVFKFNMKSRPSGLESLGYGGRIIIIGEKSPSLMGTQDLNFQRLTSKLPYLWRSSFTVKWSLDLWFFKVKVCCCCCCFYFFTILNLSLQRVKRHKLSVPCGGAQGPCAQGLKVLTQSGSGGAWLPAPTPTAPDALRLTLRLWPATNSKGFPRSRPWDHSWGKFL